MLRIAVHTTGCKVNQADAEALRRALADLPAIFVPPGQPADVIVVNACAVTEGAERDGRIVVNRSARTGASVILAGCLATRLAGDGIDHRLPETVRVVPGTADRTALADALRNEVRQWQGGDSRPAADALPARFRARPLIKVQDGCDGQCSYCIVPRLRGPSRSVPAGQIEAAVLAAAAKGASEVVLAGVDLGAWGRDLSCVSLPDLLHRLCRLGTGLRFRLSSIEPHGLDDRLLEALAAGSDVCPHLHVPAQSGSDRILRAMRRPYRAADLADRIRAFAAVVPGLSLGMDVIVGFPGETDTDFQDTRAFLQALPVSHLHVFPFSPRPGTAAADLADVPPPEVRSARSKALRDLSTARQVARTAALVGSVVEIVDVRSRAGGVIESLAADYTRVLRQDVAGPRPGRFPVRITQARNAIAWA